MKKQQQYEKMSSRTTFTSFSTVKLDSTSHSLRKAKKIILIRMGILMTLNPAMEITVAMLHRNKPNNVCFPRKPSNVRLCTL